MGFPGNLDVTVMRVTDLVSGWTVEMYTPEPGVQFYTGNFLDGTLKGNGGLTYEHWAPLLWRHSIIRIPRIVQTFRARSLNRAKSIRKRQFTDFCPFNDLAATN
jgi:hypothetical protein